MKLQIDKQNTLDTGFTPSQEQIQLWVLNTLKLVNYDKESAELTVRIVDELESQQLNDSYRNKNKPTNILSFPFEVPEGVPCDLLGDLVVCLPVVEREAKEQKKELIHHWAHLLIHGTLHLLGFDHLDEDSANEMESLEVEILKGFDVKDPYLEVD